MLVIGVFFIFKNKTNQATYIAKTAPPAEVATKPHQKIMFVGDIMVGRDVETNIDKKGFDYMFASVTPMFMDTMTIANLEGPIPAVHQHTSNLGFQFSFRPDIIQKLSDIGLDAVSLANNHGYDHGVAGYENTKKVLGETGVAYFGNYVNTANDYFETDINGKKVIVFGINVINDNFDRDSAVSNAKVLAEKNPDAMVIAFMHWGNEYDVIHNAYQEKLAEDLIDGGVDAIIGSHPHVVQDVETYKGAQIYYSLGNFVFDQYFSSSTQNSLVVLMDIQDGKLKFEERHIRMVRGRPYFTD